jgi:RimJ/RimL family protein N-acetyltransferase
MMEIPGFDIRFSQLDDAAYLSSWLSYPDACDDFPFNVEEKEEAIRNWVGFARYNASLTGMMNGTPCAFGTLFLMPYKKVSHHCSFYLIVDPQHRRKGIGTSMVRNLLHLAKERFRLESVHAEMFVPCALERILEKLHFVPFAKQDDFEKIDEHRYRPRLLVEHFFV